MVSMTKAPYNPRAFDCVIAAGGVLGFTAARRYPKSIRSSKWVLIGGGDICPSCYDQDPHETVYMLDKQRDEYELELVQRVLVTGKPVFGICRGIQMVNVALGGTLVQHLPDVKGDLVQHRMPPREPINHPVLVKAGSRLAEIVEDLNFSPIVHQALGKVADQLMVVAYLGWNHRGC